MEKLIHIFKAGKRTAMNGITIEFTEADLQQIADSYDPELHEAPIVVGHPKSDAPAYGWIKNVIAKGKDLYAEFQQVEEQFQEIVKEGRFKKISAAFMSPDFVNTPIPGKWYLRHVGFLGAAAPAVKGLKAVEFNQSDDGILYFEGVSEEKTFSDVQGELNRLKNETYVKDLLASGHVLPREKDFVVSFMDSLSDEIFAFSDAKGEHEAPQINAFKDFLENRPALVNFFEATGGSNEFETPPVFEAAKGYKTGTANEKLYHRAVALQKSEGIEFAEAVKMASDS